METKKRLLKVNKLLFGKEGIRHAVKLSEEQIKYLIEQYQDNDATIGLHNTFNVINDSYFDIGLRNYTSLYEQTDDLTNTIYYDNYLSVLMAYPSGGISDINMCIILKIPNAVLEHKQGIFENLKDGTYGIPPQYILAAFKDGKVIENPNYDRNYYSKDAEFCNQDNDYTETDKQLNIQVFEEEYYQKNKGFVNKIKNILSKFKMQKAPLLPETREEPSKYNKQKRTGFLNELQKRAPNAEQQISVSELSIKNATTHENIKDKDETEHID